MGVVDFLIPNVQITEGAEMTRKVWVFRDVGRNSDVIQFSRHRPKWDAKCGCFDCGGKVERCVVLDKASCLLLFGSPIVRPGACNWIEITVEHEE